MSEIKRPVQVGDGNDECYGPHIVDAQGYTVLAVTRGEDSDKLIAELVALINAQPDAGDVRASLHALADKDLDPSIDVEAATRKARKQLFAEKYEQPDAGDVEALARRLADEYASDFEQRKVEDVWVDLLTFAIPRASTALRAERDALAAQVATMRGALGESMPYIENDARLKREMHERIPQHPVAAKQHAEAQERVKMVQATLALTPTAAAERYAALEIYYRKAEEHGDVLTRFLKEYEENRDMDRTIEALKDAEAAWEAWCNATDTLRAIDGKGGARE